MEEIQMAIRIQLRRDVESDWVRDNPILLPGEIGIALDLNKFKIGNGSRWISTPYASSDLPEITEIAQDAIDQALSMGSGLAKSYNDNTNTISITIDDTVVALKSYVDSQLGGLENTVSSDYVLLADVGNAGGPAKLNADGNLLIPKDKIVLEGATANDYELTLQSPDVTSDITVNLPSSSGTIALLSQVPTSYNDLTNKPALFPGSYSNLTDKPTLFSGSYIDLTNKPTLFSGSYNALTEKPSLFSGVYADLTEKPSLFSGAYDDLSGKPTIPSLTGYATETYVQTEISSVIGAAPGALNTLNEIAEAINDNTSYAATITTELTAKAPLDSPTFTGTVSGITKSMVGLGNADNTTDALKPISTATLNALNLKAPLSSPEFTGTVSGITKTMVGLGNVDNTSDVEKFLIVINSQSSSYTLQGSDANKMIEMTEVSTLTIPNDSTYNFPIGTYIEVLQTTSNQVTIAGDGFTPNATPGLKLRSQWSSASLIKRAANSWVVLGDLKA
jgi:hypothetical protein